MDADQTGESSSASATTYLHTSGRKRVYCDHCSEIVGYLTFYRHLDRGYDVHTKQWFQSTNEMLVQDASESDSDSDAQEYEDGEALYYESIAPGLSLRASLYCSWPDRMRRAIASYASQVTLSFVQTACLD